MSDEVAVLVLNWNGARWLEGCLSGLVNQARGAQIWLIDNGSSDASVDFVVARYPQVRVLELGHNFGFGPAYSRALTACESATVVLLNNDTVVQPNWLEALLQEAARHPEAGAIGSKLTYLDRPGVLNHAGGQLTVLGAAYDQGLGRPDLHGIESARPISCATGAAVLIRRAAFAEVGGFDESYFAYFEDADLAWRLWLRGTPVRYAPMAHVLHAYGGSAAATRTSPFRIEHCQTNRLQNMFKNLELATLGWALPASIAFDAYRLGGLMRAGKHEAAQAHLRGTKRFLRLVPHVLKQRRRVQATRVRSDRDLFRMGMLVGIRKAATEWRRIESLQLGS